MTLSAALCVVSAAALFEAVRLILYTEDILRLRAVTRIAAALAGACLTPVAGPPLAAAAAVAACWAHPELRSRPAWPVTLLLLTPAAAIVLVSAALHDWVWPSLPVLAVDAPAAAGSVLALALAVPALRGITPNWRLRFAAALAGACLLEASLAGFAGWDAGPVVLFAAAILGALALAPGMSHRPVWPRLAAAGGLALVAPLVIAAAQAGPWTQATGSELVIVRAPLEPGGDGAYGVQTYSESGLAEGVTLVASGFQETGRSGTKAGGMAGLRARLWAKDEWIVSGEASAGIDPFSLKSGTADWQRHAQADLKLLAGWSGDLDGAPVYASMEAGWRLRPEEFSDAVTASVSAGIDLTPELQANVHAAVELDRAETRTFGQASLLWRIDDTVALEAGVQSFTEHDGGTGAQAFAGVWLRF
jgi:hypothetical protein